MSRLVLAIALTVLASCGSMKPPSEAAEKLPPQLAEFRRAIQQMGPEQIEALAIERFGQSTGSVGFGIICPVWEFEEGTLVLHPSIGPTWHRKAGGVIWLIRTENPARQNVLTSYEMTTMPHPNESGTINQVWIGNVRIDDQGAYQFVPSNMFGPKDMGDQSGNHFMKHPTGRVEVEWASEVNDQTPLEVVVGETVAHLTFISSDGRARLRCEVRSSKETRLIEITSPPFCMWTGWQNAWRVPVG